MRLRWYHIVIAVVLGVDAPLWIVALSTLLLSLIIEGTYRASR